MHIHLYNLSQHGISNHTVQCIPHTETSNAHCIHFGFAWCTLDNINESKTGDKIKKHNLQFTNYKQQYDNK